MSSSMPIEVRRQWMYNRIDMNTGCVSEEYILGLQNFMNFACRNMFDDSNDYKIWCPCNSCHNQRTEDVNTVNTHLFNQGFKPNYYVWTAHGEQVEHPDQHRFGDYNYYNTNIDDENQERPYTGEIPQPTTVEHGSEPVDDLMFEPREDVPDEETSNFFNTLDSVHAPLYENCVEGLSKFSVASDMMFVKTSRNVAEDTFDAFSRVFTHALPKGNVAAKNFYETERVMRPLRLPYHKIDVCRNNCMIYWSDEDKHLLECKFCGTPRYKPEKRQTRRGESRAKRVPYKKMFYLPVADRLKRMYLSRKTASQMRWHAEHTNVDGKMHHPSDSKAWKHFGNTFHDFSRNPRNVYLGLCTDGFNPFGRFGGSYSLWPVILTPYNLPPEMCMKREFLFLTILVPGPNHPRRTLDIFLQPLIEELKMLWSTGVEAFDVSSNERFNLKAVLLWTISDFPAFGMLSGWTTHGRLACPYCMSDTDAFWLKHGRKVCWFDCHRRWLRRNHPYRRNTKAFRREVSVNKGRPLVISGQQIFHHQVRTIDGLKKSTESGGNSHINNDIEGYGHYHHWHKHSILWELPYWSSLLIRHNLDVMHVEKNFFDNILHTIFNVNGRTKDTINSRRDLPLYCDRRSLELDSQGRAPIPIFRLQSPGKAAFLNWLKNDVKFPDGYVSNIGLCVNEESSTIYGLKSHDCHVLMQRIFPFAFSNLLPVAVHRAISDVGIFFRDLCARTLALEDVERLKKDIVQTLCNLEKIFPPSFFDVMEHLAVHLPDEADLCGPVQFRWMYPFERFMFYLKLKAKNKAHVEGSIVEAYINEEISMFTSKYYDIPGTIMNTGPKVRHAAGFVQQTNYNYEVPEIFRHVGCGSGISYKDHLNDNDKHIVHTYILLNCHELGQYERWYDLDMRSTNPAITEVELSSLKQHKEHGFSTWLFKLVGEDKKCTMYPLWLHDLASGPIRQVTCWNGYLCRGYNFHTVTHGEHKETANYGVCVRGSEPNQQSYYGKLQQVIQIAYHGAVGLKVTLFRCDWFDTTLGTGTRMRKPGVVEVLASGTYDQYDPFILSTQADQVCFLGYPRFNEEDEEWLVVVKVCRRGLIDEHGKPLEAVQEEDNDYGTDPGVGVVNIPSLVIPGGQMEEIPEDPEVGNESDDSTEDDSDVPLTDTESSEEDNSE